MGELFSHRVACLQRRITAGGEKLCLYNKNSFLFQILCNKQTILEQEREVQEGRGEQEK
jgi:hypothetical protein